MPFSMVNLDESMVKQEDGIKKIKENQVKIQQMCLEALRNQQPTRQQHQQQPPQAQQGISSSKETLKILYTNIRGLQAKINTK